MLGAIRPAAATANVRFGLPYIGYAARGATTDLGPAIPCSYGEMAPVVAVEFTSCVTLMSPC